MLASRVKMTYSLSRFHALKPQLPCLLGGEFLHAEGRFFLKDAFTRRQIAAVGSLFSGFHDGDLLEVTVEAENAGTLQCRKVRRVVRCQRPRRSFESRHRVSFTHFVGVVREFFQHRGLVEIFTPSLVPCPGLEPSLEPFALEATKGRTRRTVYLPTSPEIHLKKALALGFTDIFEIKMCFRRGEFSQHHENEFAMLEWYRGFADLALIREDLQELLEELKAQNFTFANPTLNSISFAELFKQELDFNLTPHTQTDDLHLLCKKLHIHTAIDDTFDDLFHRLLIDRIEPGFKARGPLIVRDFPPSQAALARLTPAGWADRFEFYWNGLEIANAFNEVNDPVEQRTRWQAELHERERLGTTPLTIDEGLISALEQGMPPTGGVALGLERLYMACTGVSDIRELRLFASEDLFT